MAEKYTLADARADVRRHFRLSSWLASVAMVVAYGWSITTLDDTTGGARWLWFVLPLPFIAVALWSALRDERRQDEVMRRARHEAGDLTAKFAVVLLFVLALAESAFGAPIVIPAPFGLPSDPIDTYFTAFMVLMFYVVASVLRLKRYTQGK